MNGSSSTGPVTVNSGGTLLGTGTIKGAVTVASGGTIGAGLGAGLLTLTAGLTMSASGNGPTNVWELAALKDGKTGVAGTDYDRIVLTGSSLALGTHSTLDIRFTGSATMPDPDVAFWQSTHAWTNILLSGGSNPGSSGFSKVKNGSYSAGNFTTSVSGGNIALTFTPSAVTLVAPTALAATGVTSNSFTANWSSSSGATGYRLDVSTNNGFSSYVSGFQDLDAGNALSQSVSGLNAGTAYYYRVRAYNSGGRSGNSGTIAVTTTPGGSPPVPKALAATGVTSNGFTANWSSSSGATAYQLDVSTDNGFSSYVSGYQNLDAGNILSQNVTGLNAGATYYYRVRAYNGGGTSGNSATITVATPLTLAYARQGSELVFSWPTNSVAFALEYATNLPPTNWTPASPAPVIAGAQYVVTNAMTDAARFYRLSPQ